MIILVDMDGVLADYNGEIEKEIKRRYMSPPTKEQFKNFYYTSSWPENYKKVIETIHSQKGFVFDLEPIKGGREALEKMVELGHDVRICTAPFGDYCITFPEKLAWIEYKIGNEWSKRMIITRDKTLIRGDILIDDKPEITGIVKPVWEHIIYDQPFNKGVAGKRRLTWNNWREVLEI